MIRLCRIHTRQAVYALADALNDPKQRVPAAVALLDRGWGKPLQTVAAADADSPIVLHLLAARVAGVELLQQQSTAAPADADAKTTDVVDLNAPPPVE